MHKVYKIILVGLLILGCKEKKAEQEIVSEKIEFNQNLSDELKRMEAVDQIAAYIPQGEYEKMSEQQWNSFKDSVYTTHQKRIEQVFNEFGFVGYDLAGKDGSDNFWVMVQHYDNLPWQLTCSWLADAL